MENQSFSLEVSPFSKKSVLKASATIAISGELTLAEKRLYNVLLAHAYDRIHTETVHRMLLSDVINALDRTQHRHDEIKVALEALTTTKVRYNIFGKDKRDVWGVTTPLAGAEIDATGELRYEFPALIKPFLTQPPYAKLNLKQQNRLHSSHLLTLYEFLTDSFHAHLACSETAWISLEQFQELLGTNRTEWRDIRRHLIEKPLKRLNEMQIDFTVVYRVRKSGQRIIAIKFVLHARPKEPTETEKDGNIDILAPLTFAQLRCGQLYRLQGGTEEVFVKKSETTSEKIRTKKEITMTNLDVAVELLSNRKP